MAFNMDLMKMILEDRGTTSTIWDLEAALAWQLPRWQASIAVFPKNVRTQKEQKRQKRIKHSARVCEHALKAIRQLMDDIIEIECER